MTDSDPFEVVRGAHSATAVEWVVGVRRRSNYLRHLTPDTGLEGWASRPARTLCGRVFMATGSHPEDTVTVRRRSGYERRPRGACGRCERLGEGRPVVIR